MVTIELCLAYRDGPEVGAAIFMGYPRDIAVGLLSLASQSEHNEISVTIPQSGVWYAIMGDDTIERTTRLVESILGEQ